MPDLDFNTEWYPDHPASLYTYDQIRFENLYADKTKNFLDGAPVMGINVLYVRCMASATWPAVDGYCTGSGAGFPLTRTHSQPT
jgi:hypothetical protein